MSYALKTLTEIRLKIKNIKESDEKSYKETKSVINSKKDNEIEIYKLDKLNDSSIEIVNTSKENSLTSFFNDKINNIKSQNQSKFILIKAINKTFRISHYSLENCILHVNINKLIDFMDMDDKYIEIIMKVIRFHQKDEYHKNIEKNNQFGITNNKFEINLDKRKFDILVLKKSLELIFPQIEEYCNITYIKCT